MRKTGSDIKCQNCNEWFYAPEWWLRKGAKYCSKGCADEARRGTDLGGTCIRYCPTCGKEQRIYRYRTVRTKETCCSKECKAEYLKTFVGDKASGYGKRGKDSYHWKGGYNKQKTRHRIRNLKEYRDWKGKVLMGRTRCQVCGNRNKVLIADHIAPFALFPELALVIENGRAICKGCDLKSRTYGGKMNNKKREDFVKEYFKIINKIMNSDQADC